MTLALATNFLLAKTPGPVAVNLSTTGLIEKVAAKYDCQVFRTAVGEANVVEAIINENCIVGGEGNGGVIYPTIHAGRDALVGIAMILQSLAENGESLSDQVAKLPPVVMVKTKVASDDLPAGNALAEVLAALGPGEVDKRDGMKWIGADSWVHVRPSNTEPVVRIIAEAQDQAKAADLIARVKAAV